MARKSRSIKGQPSLFEPTAPARRSSPSQMEGARAVQPAVARQCRRILGALADLHDGDDATQREIAETTGLRINVVSGRMNELEFPESSRPAMLAAAPLIYCTQRRHHKHSRVAVKAYRLTEAGVRATPRTH